MIALRLEIALPALLATLLAVGPVRADKPSAEVPVRRDAQGDPLPPGALARLGTVRLRHTTGIDSLAFTPDGKRLLGFGRRFGFAQQAGVCWDTATGKEVRRFHLPEASHKLFSLTRPYPLPQVCHKLLPPDGKTILHLQCSRLVQTDVGTGRESVTPLPEGEYYGYFSLSPDDKTVALVDHREVGKDNRLQWRFLLWDRPTAKVRYTSAWEDGDSARLVFAPDSRTLVVLGAGSELRLIDVASGARKRAWKPHAIGSAGLTFSPDGKTLVTSGYKLDTSASCLRRWDPATGKLLSEEACPQPLHSLTFFPDGKTLLGIEQSTLRLYDGKTGRRLRSLDALGKVETIALAPDGKTLATVRPSEQAVDLWDTAGWQVRHHYPGHRSIIRELAFSADDKSLLSAADDIYRQHPEGDWGVRLWDVERAQERGRFGAAWGAVTGLSLSPDGKQLAVSASDQAIHLWDTTAHREVRCLPGSKETPDEPRWSADSKEVIFLEASDVYLQDVASGIRRRLLHRRDEYRTAALSADGRLVAQDGWDHDGRVLETATGKLVSRYGKERAYAFSADGRLLATRAKAYFAIWDVVARKKRVTIPTRLRRSGFDPSPLLFTPDSRTLIGCLDDKVYVWEVASGQQRACLEGHRDHVMALALTRDGRTLATGGLDTSILLWDLTGQRLAQSQEPDAKEAARLWRQLVAADAAAAYRAMWRLALAPRQALPLLRRHVQAGYRLDAAARKQVQKLIAELDSDDFDVRTRATEELARQGERIEPLLRQALADRPGVEVQRRLRLVLDKLAEPSQPRVQLSRALEVAENMRTAEAKHYLETLAAGVPGAWLTEQAKEALGRLARQTGKP